MERNGWIYLVIILVGLAIVIPYIAYYQIECFAVKDDYENNPELAREKYSYNTFQQWLDNNEREYNTDCWQNFRDP